MPRQQFQLNEKIRRDNQVMRDGADVDVLHDDFAPLSKLMKGVLRVLLTLCLSIFAPLLVSMLLIDPKEIGTDPTDNSLDVLLKIASKYAKVEFTWGLLAGMLAAVLAVYASLAMYKYRRRHGWTTVATPYELEALFSIRPIFGLPASEFPLDSVRDPKSSLSEALISLATMLEDSFEHGIPRRILMASSQAAEGKSTMTLGLATTLARSGKRVLVIDGDLRSPSLHRYLGAEWNEGFSNLLAGASGDIGLVQVEAGFHFLSAGPIPPNSAELLNSPVLSRLLDGYSETFDHILIDSAPVLGLADAVRLSRHCELVLYAVEANRTWVYHALAALRRFGPSTNIIPVVTKIPAAQFGYTYGYGYSYGYR